jgi:ribonucleoside-diphosphate reductase alpha chain
MKTELGITYASSFTPSNEGLLILRNGKIISPDENPSEMINRIISDLASVESQFGICPTETKFFARALGEQMDEKKIVFSTPIMTNADRAEMKPLSACTILPVNLEGNSQRIKEMIDICHQEAMGIGFDLSQVDEPVTKLLSFNEIAISGAESGKEERPVGNMATCRIDHPKIVEFINSKAERQDINWKFNISVDIPNSFWQAVENDQIWELRDGKKIKAKELLHMIAESAHACADPGIICLDRLNADNPTPGVGLYTSTAPCAEVGLIPGETCQFGYINLNKFVDKSSKIIKYDELAKSANLITRALDNALELSIARYTIKESGPIMSLKRKIGVGVCGLADMLVTLGIPYDSDKGRKLCRDVISFINYQTKIASVKLAKTRGSFGAMYLENCCRYNDSPGFLEQKYGNLETTTVTSKQWKDLDFKIRSTRLLRNCSTIALPPTGRSGLVIGASTGVEPLFILSSDDGIHPALQEHLKKDVSNCSERTSIIRLTGSCQETNLSPEYKEIFKTATEIPAEGHLLMVAAIQPCVDESISKTINLPNETTVEEIESVYIQAYKMGLKGVTIFRNGSIKSQPKKVVA